MIKLITVCNKPDPRLRRLWDSARVNGIKLEILGMGRLYTGVADKFVYVVEWLKRQDYFHDVVMFVDAYDSIIMADGVEIRAAYAEFHRSIVVSGELNCWPYAHWAREHPDTPGPYKYINTGGWIAGVSAMLDLLESFELKVGSRLDDQALVMRKYIDEQVCAIDSTASIFQSMFEVDAEDVIYDPELKRVKNRITNTLPCVLHGNGGSSLEPGLQYLRARGL